MRDATVLVTGGSGFVGSHLVEELLTCGNRVIAFDRVPRTDAINVARYLDHENFVYVEGDIRVRDALASVFDRHLDVVFHLSAVVGVRHYCADPLAVIDVNVGGTRNVVELAVKHRVKVVLASTSEVYGKNPRVPWAEDDDRVLGATSVDRWSYAASKAVCEHMVLGAHRNAGLRATIVRYFNLYGPRQNPIYVVSQSVYKALRGEPCVLYDDGGQTRCFTYVKDAVAGTILAASHAGSDGEVFNIGRDRESTIKEVIELIVGLSGRSAGWRRLDTKAHYGKRYEDISRRIPDVNKARQLLGWEATTSLEQGLGEFIAWAKRNPSWLDLDACHAPHRRERGRAAGPDERPVAGDVAISADAPDENAKIRRLPSGADTCA